MNQHGFGRPGSGTLIQRVVCSAVGNPDARALRISDVRWERVNLALLGQRILRVRSGYRLRNINAVARLKLSYTFSDAFDVTCAVGAGRIRQRRLDGINTVAHVGVIWIHACRTNPDEHLTGHGTWCGEFFEFKNFGPAEFMNNDSFHCVTLIPPGSRY